MPIRGGTQRGAKGPFSGWGNACLGHRSDIFRIICKYGGDTNDLKRVGVFITRQYSCQRNTLNTAYLLQDNIHASEIAKNSFYSVGRTTGGMIFGLACAVMGILSYSVVILTVFSLLFSCACCAACGLATFFFRRFCATSADGSAKHFGKSWSGCNGIWCSASNMPPPPEKCQPTNTPTKHVFVSFSDTLKSYYPAAHSNTLQHIACLRHPEQIHMRPFSE